MVCEALQREPLSGSPEDLAKLTEFCGRHLEQFSADERTVGVICCCVCRVHIYDVIEYILYAFAYQSGSSVVSEERNPLRISCA